MRSILSIAASVAAGLAVGLPVSLFIVELFARVLTALEGAGL